MPLYKYKAIEKDSGKNVEGEIEGNNESDLIKKLELSGKYVFELNEKTEQKIESNGISLGREKEVIFFTQQMSDLLNAGVQLGEALKIINSLVKKGKIKPIISDVYENMKQGETLSDSLEKYPSYFGKSYTNMVRAGEEGGFVGVTFQRILQGMEEGRQLRSFVISSLIYPAVLMIVSIFAAIIMLVYILPKFMRIYSNYGKALPASTKMLLNISYFFQHYGIYLLAGIVGVIIGGIFYYKNSAGKKILDKLLLNIPIIGQLYIFIAVSNVIKSIATMLESGVPLLKSLEVAKYITPNVILQREIENIKNEVTKGTNLSDSIKESKYFPEIVYYMVAIGERTGKLSEMLLKTSTNFDKKIKGNMEIFVKTFEPVLIVVMGIFVGFMVFAMLLPILSINDMGM
ncbi:type II secretion system F family protein [Haliovirga abyssi]|uniref:Type II secretion system protein F n=1 Tax=Haliovirga abyssi TaxID=2996794 RepID=A0AAU9DS21_9FUSO|nr:type II secretion system F family protein [Haliovirga abyssi]BDU49779.1 type II secretion system protein F [Haliovirga abyssi]